MFIGLISDTHGIFDEPLKDFLAPVDEIWHAGDFGNIETADAIAAFKPLRGVYGNCDGFDIRADYPLLQSFDCEGMKVLMTHIGGYPGKYDRRVIPLFEEHIPDIFICGHSHILKVINDHGRGFIVINPGAAGVFGSHLARTALRFHISSSKITDMEVYELPKHSGQVL